MTIGFAIGHGARPAHLRIPTMHPRLSLMRQSDEAIAWHNPDCERVLMLSLTDHLALPIRTSLPRCTLATFGVVPGKSVCLVSSNVPLQLSLLVVRQHPKCEVV
jgi:hypothetical protein